MKKTTISTILALILMLSSISGMAAFTAWESPRYIPADEYKTPWTEAKQGNPYYTYYAPWLRQLHMMTEVEAANNKDAGIVGGEACQQIRALAISPVNTQIMYFCTDTSGVYKTTTGGEHWYNVTNNAAGHDAKGLLCDIKDENIVYVNMRKVGVHRSVNGGYTWEQIVADTDSQSLKGACGEEFRRSNTIAQDKYGNTYMAVGSGIYKLDRATDTLTNLTATSFPDMANYTGAEGVVFLDLDVSPEGDIIYAAVVPRTNGGSYTSGLYVSVDGGTTWKVRNSNPNNSAQTYEHIMSVAIDPADSTGKTIYAGLEVVSDTSTDVDKEYSLYKSEDAGETYTKVWGPYSAYSSAAGKYLYKYFYGLTFGPKNTQGVYPLYLHLQSTNWPLRVSYDYRSENPTFSQVYSESDKMDADTIRAGYTGSDYQAFAPDMTTPGRVIYASSGVYEKSSGGTIKRITSGFSGAALQDIVFDSNNKMIAPAVDTGLYKADSAYTKENTTPTFTKNTTTLYATRALIDPNNDNHIFVFSGSSNGGKNRRIQESINGGTTFTVETATDALLDEDNGEINATVLCYDKDNKNTIYSSYHNSYDNGETWEPNDYFILDVHPQNTKLQVGISGWGESTVLYKTIDGGTTWEKVMDLGFSDISDADFDLNNQNHVWITREIHNGKNAFIRVDLEKGTFDDYTSKFDYHAFRRVEINPKDPNHILVASYPGRNSGLMDKDFKLAESYNGGQSWHTVPGLWGGDFNNIVFSPTTDEVFITGLAGTFIYDYTKLNYHQAMKFTYDGQSVIKELLRVNEEGKNVNNGTYVLAPEDLFKPANKIFTGWKIGEEIYQPGDKIPISN